MMDYSGLSTEHYKKIVEVLGADYVQAVLESPYDFISAAKEGISPLVIDNFRRYFDITLKSTSEILGVSEPSIYRWTKAERPLESNVSILLLEVVDLFLYGTEVFGTKDNFFKWLALSNTAMGGMEPEELVKVPGGVSKIRDILGRIEYGVYS
jgi:putative toxin-antitoxin system antitoxin component (TIGR02293 family)